MLTDKLILYPSTAPISTAAERRMLASGLELWLHRRPAATQPAKPLSILHFIGNGSRAEWEAVPALEHLPPEYDVKAWTLNYPGYGGSPGPARLASIPPSALEAFDAIAPDVVSGNSLGTAAALHVASQRPVRALLLQNPAPLQRMILGSHGWWNLWLLALPVSRSVPVELNTLLTGPRASGRALFLCATNDGVVPPRYQAEVVAGYGGPSRRIHLAGAGHNDPVPPSLSARVREELGWLLEAR